MKLRVRPDPPESSLSSAASQQPMTRLRFVTSTPFVFVVYTLLAFILTYPLPFNLTTTVPNDIGDPLLNTWILAWDSHALLADPLNLFNANIFYPLPNTLAYSEHLFSTALLALPAQLISGEPILAYNLSLLATFPLAALGMYLLALHWTRQRSAAFIAGLVFAFTPYRFAAIAHLQLLTFQWLPFILLFADKLLDKKQSGVRRQGAGVSDLSNLLALTLLLVLQLLTSWYLALYTGLILGIYLLFILPARRPTRPALSRLGLALLISGGLVLPFTWPYFVLLDELQAARPLAQSLPLAAAPTDFAAAAPFNRLFGPLTTSLRTRPAFTAENTLFAGLIAPLLTLASLPLILRTSRFTLQSRRPPMGVSRFTFYVSRFTLYALLLILFLSLCLTFALPYATLTRLIPPSAIIRVPARWIIPALFALAGLAAFGYAMLNNQLKTSNPSPPTRHPPEPTKWPAEAKAPYERFTFHASEPKAPYGRFTFLLLLTCSLLLGESLSTPLPLAQVEHRLTLSPAYQWLAAQPADFALIELPLHSAPAPEFSEVKRLYASTLNWWPLVNGYSGYTPPRQPHLAQALAGFPDAPALAALQMLTSFKESPSLASFSADRSHFAASPRLLLLVHPGEAPFDRTQWESGDRWQAERNPALWPLGQFAGDYLYHILPPAPTRFTTPPIATFGSSQAIQLLSYELSLPDSSFKTQNPELPARLAFYWRLSTPLPADYTIFIHLRAPDNFVRSQADGPPVSGHYPTSAWSKDEVIQDIHLLPAEDFTQIDHLAVGLYDPSTGERLPAFAADGQPLPQEAFLIPLHR